MSKLADMSEEETEEALRAIEQAISKQVPSIGRGATERILSELKNAILERRDERQENGRRTRWATRRRRRRRQSMGRRGELRDTLRKSSPRCLPKRSAILRLGQNCGIEEQELHEVPEFLAVSGGEDQGKHEERIGEERGQDLIE